MQRNRHYWGIANYCWNFLSCSRLMKKDGLYFSSTHGDDSKTICGIEPIFHSENKCVQMTEFTESIDLCSFWMKLRFSSGEWAQISTIFLCTFVILKDLFVMTAPHNIDGLVSATSSVLDVQIGVQRVSTKFKTGSPSENSVLDVQIGVQRVSTKFKTGSPSENRGFWGLEHWNIDNDFSCLANTWTGSAPQLLYE